MNSFNLEEKGIKKMYDFNDVIELKNYAINKQDFELAAMAIDQEKFLNTPEGYEFISKCKRELLEEKLLRINKNRL